MEKLKKISNMYLKIGSHLGGKYKLNKGDLNEPENEKKTKVRSRNLAIQSLRVKV